MSETDGPIACSHPFQGRAIRHADAAKTGRINPSGHDRLRVAVIKCVESRTVLPQEDRKRRGPCCVCEGLLVPTEGISTEEQEDTEICGRWNEESWNAITEMPTINNSRTTLRITPQTKPRQLRRSLEDIAPSRIGYRYRTTCMDVAQQREITTPYFSF